MNRESFLSSSSNKWQRMQAIVERHPMLPQVDYVQQFKKLIWRRLLAENVLVFLLQYIGLMFSTLTPQTFPVWFATGTACAFTFLRGFSVLPGIWLGTFVAYYFSESGFLLACGCATVFALQAFLLVGLCYRFIYPTLVFYRKMTFVKFILCSALLTAIVTVVLEMMCYFSLRVMMDPLQLWLQWWLANFNGMMVVAVALVALDAFFPQIRSVKKDAALIMLFGLWLVLIVALVLSESRLAIMLLALSTLPIIFVMSERLGWCGVVAANFLLALFLNLAACLGAPLFAYDFMAVNLVYLQVVLCLEAVVGLYLAI